jgi:hypothetical protein
VQKAARIGIMHDCQEQHITPRLHLQHSAI